LHPAATSKNGIRFASCTTMARKRKTSNDKKDKPAHKPSRINEAFHKFSTESARVLGSVWAFAIAVAVVAVWAITGPIFDYSEEWQLVINTGTTIVTFLMVFLIQNTQNRDARALHLKLDELIRALTEARTGLVDLEDLPEEELDRLADEFKRLRKSDKRKVCEEATEAKA
jgi:low affinity Fe/Cu permease